jgi:hypothetical protein
MAGMIAGRYPDRAGTLGILFSDRHLHHSQPHPELAVVALLDVPALRNFQSSRGTSSVVATGVARLGLHMFRPYANGPQGRGYKNYPDTTRSTCARAAAVPSLPGHEIGASFRRRNRQ